MTSLNYRQVDKVLAFAETCLNMISYNTFKMRENSNALATKLLLKNRVIVIMLRDVTMDNPQPIT